METTNANEENDVVVNEVETTMPETSEKEASIQQSYGDIIRNCIKEGWTRKTNLKVKNVTINEEDNYTRVTFTVIPPVPGIIMNQDTMEYEEGMTHFVFSSTYAIAGAIKENEDLAWLANNIVEKPKFINAFFNGGTIDILQKKIIAGEEFIHPFSSNTEPQYFDHDTYINIVIGLNLGKNGEKTVAEARRALAMSMFD